MVVKQYENLAILREIDLALKSQKLREIMVNLLLRNCSNRLFSRNILQSGIWEQFLVFPQCVRCDLMKNYKSTIWMFTNSFEYHCKFRIERDFPY